MYFNLSNAIIYEIIKSELPPVLAGGIEFISKALAKFMFFG